MSTPRSALEALSAAGLLDLHDKVRAGTRLSADDGLRLFQCPDVAAVGHLANLVRERLHGNLTWYNRNLHVNATNVCEASCIFCSFARLETGDPNAWTMSYDQALDRIKVLDDALVTEVHIVNGLNPDLPYDYYLELMRRIKAHRPDIHVKGFTAVEIHYYAEKYGMTVEAVLETMRGAGLDSMPGGGAEIFADRARRKLCHDKVDAQGWLDIHAEAHRQGIFTNCTMLFGSIETLEERVDHLLRLRDLQDRSLRDGAMLPDHGGAHFQTFIPLRFHNDNNRLARLASPTGHDSLRTIAVARLLLDNIPHIKAYWPMLGTNEAQAALWYGASDLDGTVREEHIYHMAGAETPQGLSPDDLVRFIRHAGRLPAERDTLYNVVSRKDPARPTTPATRVKVGWVDYSNAAPLVRHLDGVERIGGHPSEVAARLSRGEVELALLPVGALLSDGRAPGRRLPHERAPGPAPADPPRQPPGPPGSRRPGAARRAPHHGRLRSSRHGRCTGHRRRGPCPRRPPARAGRPRRCLEAVDGAALCLCRLGRPGPRSRRRGGAHPRRRPPGRGRGRRRLLLRPRHHRRPPPLPAGAHPLPPR
jgi:aminodeoxyfutalosine synthase